MRKSEVLAVAFAASRADCSKASCRKKSAPRDPRLPRPVSRLRLRPEGSLLVRPDEAGGALRSSRQVSLHGHGAGPEVRGGGALRGGRRGACRPLGRADPARAPAGDRCDDGEGREANDLGCRRDQRRRGRGRGPRARGQRQVLRVHREAVRGPHGAECAPGPAASLRLQSRPRLDRARAPARHRERPAALRLSIGRDGLRRARRCSRRRGNACASGTSPTRKSLASRRPERSPRT